jgi:hypothetical protein
MTRRAVVVCTLVIAGTMAVVVDRVMLAQGADPHVGTWKLNLAKSKFSPGPGPKALTIVYTADASGLVQTTQGTDPDGKPINPPKLTIMFDGKDHPTPGNPNWDTTAWKRVDGRTFELERKKGGKMVNTATSTVSADGKTMTTTARGVSPQGQPNSTATLVYDRQ